MLWIVFMTSLYMYYALCFVLVERSVCHEPISVLINTCMHVYIYIYIYINLAAQQQELRSIGYKYKAENP